MRRRIPTYTISRQTISIQGKVGIEDIRLIVNETQEVVICSSMQKKNIETILYAPLTDTTTITVPTAICTLNTNDLLTIEIDKGEEAAKQGENKEATLTAIYKLLVGNDTPTQDILEDVAERLALILEFFGIKPIQAYEFMTEEEVCSTLEEIMTAMDISLTPEQAKEITNNTLNKG